MIGRLSSFSLFFCLAASAALAQGVPAFPGADGAAANVTGGRGGIVYHVTKLDRNYSHNELGTLRYGLSDSNFIVNGQVQPRTIVFDVAGTFWLGRFGAERGHHNGWDTQSRLNLGSNVTIAGQTAPGPVTIMGGLVKAGGNNAILRNVTIAPGYGMRTFEQPDADPPVLPTPGDFPDTYVYDAIDISGKNIMIDHVSSFYATDETISANEQVDNITIQYSNVSQGQNYPQADAEGGGNFTGHAFGSLLQGGSNSRISVHHNVYAHQKGRLPRVGTRADQLTVPGVGAFNDFRNNVFYNWLSTAGTGASNQPSQNNFVGNYYLAGPGGDDPIGGSNPAITNRAGGTGIFSGNNATGTKIYHASNIKDTNKNGTAEFVTALTNSDFGSSSFQGGPQWHQGMATYSGVTDTAAAAYDRVLRYAGATWWLRDYDYTLRNADSIDTVDERIIHELVTGTGKIRAWADDPFNNDPNEGVEWRHLLSFRADPATGAAPFTRNSDWDTDGDGMPDFWEKAHGLNPSAPNNNGDFDSDGYTDLEEYINEIAAWPAPQPLSFNGATGDRYAQITNWDIRWQPSRHDEVHINSGTALVDAPGQHAGLLVIAENEGDTAQLHISGGWLRVHEAVLIGASPSAAGVLNLSGGTLSAPLVAKGPAGELHFTGGTLQADVVDFDLIVQGGTIAPGNDIHTLTPGTSFGATHVRGDLELASGAVEIELGSQNAFDRVLVDGSAALGGELRVKLLDGYLPAEDHEFTILDAQSLVGTFTNVDSSGRLYVEGGGSFRLTLSSTTATLSDFLAAPELPGDYNRDGTVDAADYLLWRKHDGSPEGYNVWRSNFGNSLSGGGSAVTEGVGVALPEPSFFTLSLLAAWELLTGRHGRANGRDCNKSHRCAAPADARKTSPSAGSRSDPD